MRSLVVSVPSLLLSICISGLFAALVRVYTPKASCATAQPPIIVHSGLKYHFRKYCIGTGLTSL